MKGEWLWLNPPLPKVDENEPVRVEEVKDRQGRVWMMKLIGTVSGEKIVHAR